MTARAVGSEGMVTLTRVTVTPDIQMTFSVATQPRVYALLLGSGISKGAGVPTGWEVAEDLARRLADQQKEDPGDDPIGWFKSWSGDNPDYPSFIEALAPSPADRRNLLRGYFEPISDDELDPAPVPSSAHRSIAALVAQGLVSVIVTTNFDRLLERAIADAGKEPVVIATPDAARGAEPFAHSDITVVKVNGDYLSPDLKNTVDELSPTTKTPTECSTRYSISTASSFVDGPRTGIPLCAPPCPAPSRGVTPPTGCTAVRSVNMRLG